jgi:hypothetical protein
LNRYVNQRHYKIADMKKQIIVLIFFIFTSLTSNAQISIDLNKIELNGSIKISELNAETITNILGRPSAIANNEAIVDFIGNEIFYHSLGLSFEFNTKKKDLKQKVKNMDIYLVKTWDEKRNEFFMPFLDELIPELSPNMKIEEILFLFENDNAYILTAKEIYEKNRETFKKANLNINSLMPVKYDNVVVEKENYIIVVICEEITKFPEEIHIKFN